MYLKDFIGLINRVVASARSVLGRAQERTAGCSVAAPASPGRGDRAGGKDRGSGRREGQGLRQGQASDHQDSQNLLPAVTREHFLRS